MAVNVKILYISFYFAPYNNIAAVRATKMTKYLRRKGADIQVLSACRQPLPDDLALEIPEENVIYSNWLNINSYFSLLTGEKSNAAAKRTYLTSRQKKNYLIKRLVKIYKSVVYFPDGKNGWIWPAYRNAKKLFESWKPDIIYVSGGPFSGFIIGAILHKKTGIPWIAEYRDPWTKGYQNSYGKIRENIEKRLEDRVISSAERLVTISDGLARQLKIRFSQEVFTITNGFDPEDRENAPKVAKEYCAQKLHIVYTGQIYINNKDLSPLFEALEKDPFLKNKIKVHFYGPNIKEKIKQKFNADLLKKISSNLQFYGLVSHEEAMRAQEAADLLLLLGWTDQNFSGVLTGKLFEYLGARKQILAINNHLDDASKLVLENKVGFFCSSSSEVIEKLKELIVIKKNKRAIKPPSNSINSFSHATKAKQLLKILRETL